MKRVFSLLLLTLISLGVFAQQAIITGIVYEKGPAKEPLEGVTLILDNTTGIFSDSLGNYTLKTSPGEHTLTVKYLSFETQEQKVTLGPGEVKTLDIAMRSDGEEMDVVVISGSQFEKKIAEETITIEVLDAQLGKNINAPDVGELIDKSVGVQVQDGQVSMRGGSSWAYGVGSRTAVMMDNVSFLSADLADAQLRQVPVELIDRVEVIKGASSVVYGSSALNGVVNVLTKWPGAKPSTEVTLFQGIYSKPPRPELQWWSNEDKPGFSGLSFSHAQKAGEDKNLDLVFGGNFNNVNSFLEKADERRYRMDFKTRYNVPSKPGMSFGVNGNYMYENFGRFYIAENLTDKAYIRGDGSFDVYHRTNIDPHFTYLSEKGTLHRVRARWLQVYRDDKGSGDEDARSNQFSLDYQFQKRFGENVVLTVGTPFAVGYAFSNLYDGKRYSGSAAVYAQAEYKLNRLSLVGGLRYEAAAVDVVFATRLPVFRTGLNYQIARGTFLRTSWGQAYRIPSVAERLLSADVSGIDLVPNPDLRPEKSWGYELGLKQMFKLNKWMAYADFSVFWNEYEEFIEYIIDFFPPPGENPTLDDLGLQPRNIFNARVLGYEVSGFSKGKIGPVGIRALLGYTYHYPGNLELDTTQRNVKTFLNNAIYGMFNRFEDVKDENGYVVEDNTSKLLFFRTRHLIKGDIEISYDKFALGSTFNYQSYPEHIYFLYIAAVPGLADFSEEHKMGDWFFGLRGSWQFHESARVSLIAKNITNKEYALRPGRLEAPRNLTLQLLLNF